MTLDDRVRIAVGIKAGKTDTEIGKDTGRNPTVIWRERTRNASVVGGYRPVAADRAAQKRRSRPQTRKIDADPQLQLRVRADLP